MQTFPNASPVARLDFITSGMQFAAAHHCEVSTSSTLEEFFASDTIHRSFSRIGCRPLEERELPRGNSRKAEAARAVAAARRCRNCFYLSRLSEVVYAHARHDARLPANGIPGVLRLHRRCCRIFRRNRLDSRTIEAHRRAAAGGRDGRRDPEGAFATGTDHGS